MHHAWLSNGLASLVTFKIAQCVKNINWTLLFHQRIIVVSIVTLLTIFVVMCERVQFCLALVLMYKVLKWSERKLDGGKTAARIVFVNFRFLMWEFGTVGHWFKFDVVSKCFIFPFLCKVTKLHIESGIP